MVSVKPPNLIFFGDLYLHGVLPFVTPSLIAYSYEVFSFAILIVTMCFQSTAYSYRQDELTF